MKVIARITLREMTEDERPDEVGPTGAEVVAVAPLAV